MVDLMEIKEELTKSDIQLILTLSKLYSVMWVMIWWPTVMLLIVPQLEFPPEHAYTQQPQKVPLDQPWHHKRSSLDNLWYRKLSTPAITGPLT